MARKLATKSRWNTTRARRGPAASSIYYRGVQSRTNVGSVGKWKNKLHITAYPQHAQMFSGSKGGILIGRARPRATDKDPHDAGRNYLVDKSQFTRKKLVPHQKAWEARNLKNRQKSVQRRMAKELSGRADKVRTAWAKRRKVRMTGAGKAKSGWARWKAKRGGRGKVKKATRRR
jgi:hypothetical protein